jgi:hypothetical protein
MRYTAPGRSAVVRPALALALFASFAALAFEVSPTSLSVDVGAGPVTETVTVTVPADAVVPTVDVYLLADTTGSMGGPLAGVKTGATEIAAALYDDFGAAGIDVAIGVGNYKDFPYDSYAFDHQLAPAVASGEADVLTEIGNWWASGGYDGSEGQLFALDRLANDADPAGGDIGWRDGAKKVVVWFGDWPGHDPICSSLTGLGYDITEATTTDYLVDAGITVVAISTTSGYGLDYNPDYSAGDYGACTPNGEAGQATRITAATGGSHISGVDSASITSTIITLVGEVAGEIGKLELTASGDAAAYVTDIDPAYVGPIDTSEESTWDFDVTFDGECLVDGAATFAGTLDAKADGAVVGSVDVSVDVPACDVDPPKIDCNAWNITPPDAPIDFTATAWDEYEDDYVDAWITDYWCYGYTGTGKVISKMWSCVVSYDGDTLTILDSGGVGDHIVWTVEATDPAGNMATEECEIVVERPLK